MPDLHHLFSTTNPRSFGFWRDLIGWGVVFLATYAPLRHILRLFTRKSHH
jgi:hypothetical protein